MQRREGARSLSTNAAIHNRSQVNRTLDTERLRVLLENERNGVIANGGGTNGSVMNGGVSHVRNDSKLPLPPINENGDFRAEMAIHSGTPTKTQPLLSDLQLGVLRQYATVGVQTDDRLSGDEEGPTPKSSGFVVGSETPPSDQEEEQRSETETEQVPSTPRPIEECLTVYKSEVH